jgi:hypothetical protein
VAEFGGLPLLGSLPADIEGDGEEVEEWMPFVCIPGGMGRFALEESDWTAVADGAILDILRYGAQSIC